MKHKATLDSVSLEDFASTEWLKITNYLNKTFGLSQDDCKDVFQESFLILYKNISEGRLTTLTSSLSTYFTGICRHKALERIRHKAKHPAVDDETSLALMDGQFKEDKINTLLNLYDNEMEKKKQGLVNRIVNHLPAPCNQLLWGFYRDELSLKTLAQMYNYSEGSIKVVKHRCTEKFRVRYQELIKKFF